MEWYREWFGKDYLAVYPHRSLEQAREQRDFMLELLAPQADQKLLDMTCGAKHPKHVTLASRPEVNAHDATRRCVMHPFANHKSPLRNDR